MPKNLTPPDAGLFFSKNDANDPRLGDLAKKRTPEAKVVILGYPDDDGVRANGGRAGARLGPAAIRERLYRLTPAAEYETKSFQDLGDLSCEAPLEERLDLAASLVEEQLKKDRQVLSLGGGNDYAYADGLGFLRKYENKNPLIINIDAHLDVRDLKNGITSGTPFFRLLEQPIGFSFLELGAQSACNAKAHWDYVEQKGGHILSLDSILNSPKPFTTTVMDALHQILGDRLLRRPPTFLAIDMDAFPQSQSPGVSAPSPIGLDALSFYPLYQLLLQRLDVRVVGLYETAPELESENRTARLAASLAHGFLHAF